MKAILTVIGKDKPGIIASVSAMLAEASINIEDISQTILQGNFTMIMMVNTEHSAMTMGELSAACRALGEQIGVTIRAQPEEIFRARHEIGGDVCLAHPIFLKRSTWWSGSIWISAPSPWDCHCYPASARMQPRRRTPSMI